MNLKKFAKAYMIDCLRNGEYLDCGEVQITQLAEDAQDHFNDYCEEFFEWSFEVGEWWAKQPNNKRG